MIKHFILICLLFQTLLAHTQSGKKLELSDLGIESTTKADPVMEQKMEKRRERLYFHQVTGITTMGLMVASLVTAGMVEKNNVHQILGMTTAATYWTTFYLSQSAPKVNEGEQKGMNIKIHKASRWVHAPLMVLTPIIGLIAHNQIRSGEGVHGIGELKGFVGGAAAASYLIGTSVMFFEF